jgi:hypothetical protein
VGDAQQLDDTLMVQAHHHFRFTQEILSLEVQQINQSHADLSTVYCKLVRQIF